MMSLREGQFHKKRMTFKDWAIWIVEFIAVVAVIIFIAKVGVDALIKEDIIRVEKLQQHQYDVALRTGSYSTPAAPSGLKPNYGESSTRPRPEDLAVPKTRMFQDASERQKKGR